MTYFCELCDVAWWPYMAPGGCCPQCGGGTQRVWKTAHPDAVGLHGAALVCEEARVWVARCHLEFEEFYLAREVRFNGLDGLVVAEPQRRLSAASGPQ